MNRRLLASLIGQLYRAPADGDGGAGGGGGGSGDGGAGGQGGDKGGAGDQAPAIKPEDARAALAQYVLDAEQLKAMPDEVVVKHYAKIDGANKKAFADLTAKQQQERLEAAKGIKLELPQDSKLVQSDIDRISAIVREKGLSKAEADVLVAEANAAAVAVEARQKEQAVMQVKAWQDQVKSDPEIGGEKLAVTQRNAQRVFDTFLPNKKDEKGQDVVHPLRRMLRETGFGDHPEVVRFFNQVGAAMGEDKGLQGQGGGSGNANTSIADKLYNNTPS